jgi:hypothetical protein
LRLSRAGEKSGQRQSGAGQQYGNRMSAHDPSCPRRFRSCGHTGSLNRQPRQPRIQLDIMPDRDAPRLCTQKD